MIGLDFVVSIKNSLCQKPFMIYEFKIFDSKSIHRLLFFLDQSMHLRMTNDQKAIKSYFCFYFSGFIFPISSRLRSIDGTIWLSKPNNIQINKEFMWYLWIIVSGILLGVYSRNVSIIFINLYILKYKEWLIFDIF